MMFYRPWSFSKLGQKKFQVRQKFLLVSFCLKCNSSKFSPPGEKKNSNNFLLSFFRGFASRNFYFASAVMIQKKAVSTLRMKLGCRNVQLYR